MGEPMKYVRVYYSIIDDERFEGVYDDDHALALWLRLLLIADATWPAPAHLPHGHRKAALRALADAGLVELLPGARYRVHGLDRERDMRTQSARNAAALRWQSERSQHANAEVMPRRAETSRDEQSIDVRTADASDDDRPDLEAWLLVRRRPPTERQRAFLDAYQATFDVTGPTRAERLILEHPDDPIAALKADLDEFRQRRLAEAKAAERSVPRPPRRNGGLSPLNVELAKLLRDRDAAAGVAVETKS